MRRRLRVQRNGNWSGGEGENLYENDTQSGNHLSGFQAHLFEEEPDDEPEDDDSDYEDDEPEDDELEEDDDEPEDDDSDYEDDQLEDDELEEEGGDPEDDDSDHEDAELEVDDLPAVDDDLDLTWISAKQRVKSQVSDGVLSIVNTAKNGRRISIANKVLQKLGADQFVKLAVKDNQIVVTAASSLTGSFQLKSGTKRGVIYSKALVEHLTELLGLSFTQQTTVSFSQVSYKTHQSQVIAIIS